MWSNGQLTTGDETRGANAWRQSGWVEIATSRFNRECVRCNGKHDRAALRKRSGKCRHTSRLGEKLGLERRRAVALTSRNSVLLVLVKVVVEGNLRATSLP